MLIREACVPGPLAKNGVRRDHASCGPNGIVHRAAYEGGSAAKQLWFERLTRRRNPKPGNFLVRILPGGEAVIPIPTNRPRHRRLTAFTFVSYTSAPPGMLIAFLDSAPARTAS